MDSKRNAHEVLSLLEKGEIDVAEAELRLIGNGDGECPGQELDRNSSRWWKVFSILLAMLGTGSALGLVGGLWWICAGPLILIGGLGGLIMVAALSAPWVHVRVDLEERGWPRSLSFSLPLPLRSAGWMLGRLQLAPSRQWADVDALLRGLDDALRLGQPIEIEVEETWGGERVEITLG